MTGTGTVLVTGGRPIVLHGLAGVLQSAGIPCRGVEGRSQPERRPAVIVVDVAGQEDARAAQLVELAAATYAEVPVLALADRTPVATDPPAGRHVHWLAAGSPPAAIVAEVHRLAAGVAADDPGDGPTAALSPREREVVDLVLAGHDDRAVAATLGIGTGTVRTHLRRAAAKLGLDGRLRVAGQRGLAGAADTYQPPAARAFAVVVAVEASEALAGAAVEHLVAAQPPFRLFEPPDDVPDVVVVVGAPTDVAAVSDRRPGVPIVHVASAARDDDPYESVRRGAHGYVGASDPPAELVAAVERVALGGAHLSPARLRGLVEGLRAAALDDDDAVRRLVELTRTERSILALVAEGRTVSDIAEALVVSPLTARTHVQSILRKLGAHSQAEAAAYARRHRLVERGSVRGGP